MSPKKEKKVTELSPVKSMLLAGVAFPLLIMVIIMFFSAQLDRHQIAFGTKIPKNYQLYGIDVSHHQGTILWEKLVEYEESGKRVNFVFMKATEGSQIKDATFEKNWDLAKKLGITRGAYHFYRPEEPIDKQCSFFLKNVKLEKGDLPPVVDIEITSGKTSKQLREGLKKWLEIIESHTCVKPIIYTNLRFYHKHLANYFTTYPLWIAKYDRESFELKDSATWLFWQYSQTGSLPGIRGKVDLNVFTGTKDDFLNLLLKDSCQYVKHKAK